MEDTRKEIRKAVDEVLTEVEHDADVTLGRVVEDFEEKLLLATEYETRAFQSIANETLLISTLSTEAKVIKKEEVIFGDRMRVFQQVFEEEEKALESLWREWTEIQHETVCLAFEVLGPDEVVIKEEEMSLITPGTINRAIECHEQHQHTLNGTLDKMVAVQNSVKKVTSRTMKTLKEQQEVSSRRLR